MCTSQVSRAQTAARSVGSQAPMKCVLEPCQHQDVKVQADHKQIETHDLS